jgi:hypothetical protein
MNTIIRVAIVMVTAGFFSGLLAAVVVSAFGWPLGVAAALAGVGAGASGVLVYQRMRGGKAG